MKYDESKQPETILNEISNITNFNSISATQLAKSKEKKENSEFKLK